MEGTNKSIQFLHFLRSFLPLQLLFTHLKFNLVAILYWIVLFLIVSDNLGYAFGIPILFYSPEYLGNVSPISFALLGFAIGGFIMAFNTYSYVKLGPKFPFLVLIGQPFFKFCKNNGIVPLLFILYYIYKMARFQHTEEFASVGEILFFILSFLGGILLFIVLSIAYFFPISKRIMRMQRSEGLYNEEEQIEETAESIIHNPKRPWYHQFQRNKNKIYIYIGNGFTFSKSRSIRHISPDVIEKIYAGNRINTSIFELLTIISYVILGLFSSNKAFEMPAAMSIVLLFTIILMLFSAMQSWFGKWTYGILIGSLVIMNFLSLHTPYFTFKNYAYGLKYGTPATANYSIEAIESSAQEESQENSSMNLYLKTLDSWKAKSGERLPKLIILNTSGGGSRSALWTFGALQKLDKELDGQLQKSLHLITGASGGMIGASYFRELMLRNKHGEIDNLYSKEYRDHLGKDLLNKLSFSASTNDIFFRYQNFLYNNQSYSKDRGYAFEEQLHENTNYFMEHSLGYYEFYEQKATIPTMIFTPTIVNDGRRLLIGSQCLRFLTNNTSGQGRVTKSFENIDYQTFFADLNPNEIRFSSVMRSSATFPFVMPMVTMPSNPEIQLMDAGIRDNYGGKITMEFLNAMKDWLKENTSGVIILQIRDTKKMLENESYKPISFIDKLTMPFGNMYKNFPRTQDFDQDELFKVGTEQFSFPVDLVTFNLRESKDDRISLSWHLTSQEKLKVEKAFESKLNKNALSQLKRLLNQEIKKETSQSLFLNH